MSGLSPANIVVTGATQDGTKELLAVVDSKRESYCPGFICFRISKLGV